MRGTACIIMAAGLGKRMAVPVPKVLLTIAGKPLIEYVVESAIAAGVSQTVVVVGHGREQVAQALTEYEVTFAVQEEQLGTAHAVMQAMPHLNRRVETILTMSGDSPLVSPGTMESMMTYHRKSGNAATVLTANVPEPAGYGRILRDPSGDLLGIVEDRDCDEAQRRITEVNSSIYCFQRKPLAGALTRVGRKNVQGEYYLTDVIGILRERGLRVGAVTAPDWREVLGANEPEELALLESIVRKRSQAG